MVMGKEKATQKLTHRKCLQWESIFLVIVAQFVITRLLRHVAPNKPQIKLK